MCKNVQSNLPLKAHVYNKSLSMKFQFLLLMNSAYN